MTLRARALACLLCLVAATGHAQTRDNPMRVAIDATEWPKGILHTQIVFPANPGPLTLYFPKWIPGTHRPEGNSADLAGLSMRADGRPVAWVRDTLDYWTFHCDVPPGARALEVRLDALNVPTATDLGFFDWSQAVLYPAGPSVSQIYCRPAVKLPAGWSCATALDSTGASADGNEYAVVSLENLIDSPVLGGAHSRRLDLGQSFGAPVEADLYCSSVEGLDFKPDFTVKMKAIVREANALFGARHFAHYRFLIGLGELHGDLTLEHHQCNAYTAGERDLVDRGPTPLDLGNLAHEFTHSWCGKYRRPVGLAFHDYQHPENSELLWVYEGLDQYLGYVMNGRSGFYPPSSARAQFIRSAASLTTRSGREWRPLRDTAIQSGPLRDASDSWSNWRRGQDYYVEGALIWLEADAIIRNLSGGRKSLDDFCRSFLGGASTGAMVNPYSEAQVVAALAAVQPYDWKRFLDERIDRVDLPEPARALEAAGWRLTFADTADAYESAAQARFKGVNLAYSLGIGMRSDGAIQDVRPDGPAGVAGLAPGMKLIGINGRTFDKDVVMDALKSARASHRPLELLVTWGDVYKTFTVDCTTGPRYPAGEHIPGKPDYLSKVLHLKPPAERPASPTALKR